MNENSSPAVRPAEQLLIDLIPELPTGKLLANSLGRAQFARAYSEAQPTALVTCWFLELFHCEESQAALGEVPPANLQVICATDFPEEEFDIVALALQKAGDGELTRELLQQAHERLKIGGQFVAAIDHPHDSWLHDQLHKLYEKVTRRPLKTGVVYLATKKTPLKKLKNYRCEMTQSDSGRVLQVLSRPGVFSHREIDVGAKALIEIMQVEPGNRVLDLGCGSGVVGLVAAARAPGVTVHAIDSNPRAIECMQWGAAQNELTNITATLDCDGRSLTADQFDLVLANPPYYSNFRLAELFVVIASQTLVLDGYLLVVTKQPQWYIDNLPAHGFREIDVHPVKGYRVITCMKGEAVPEDE
ncbi:MAG TPA: methyltransferase [Pirellulaceae bacterium]|nr:methyltransferase [Pirellulaceae bacterium]